MRDDQSVETCADECLSKLGMARRKGVARSEAHRTILDRLFLAVGMNGVEKFLELR